jgi:hypothetical protein
VRRKVDKEDSSSWESHTDRTPWFDKTFKREFAFIAFCAWVAFSIKVFWFASVEVIGALGIAYGTASASIWPFILAAFGMDFAVRQMWRGGRGGRDDSEEEEPPPHRMREGAPKYPVSASRPKLSPGGGRMPDEN